MGRVEVSRSEVVVDGRTRVVLRRSGPGCVQVEDGAAGVELALLDVESYTRTVVRARWRGQWLTVTGQEGPDHVVAWYQGDPDLAREVGLHGDQRDGWVGSFPVAELTDVEVERTAYDVPQVLATTPRPYALDQALLAAGRPKEAVAWIREESDDPLRHRGRWAIRATRTGFALGAEDRGVFATYDLFPTGAPAIELAVRLVTEPLRRIVGTTPDQDEAGRRTGEAIVDRTTTRGGAAGPAGSGVGDLLDCLGPESGRHLYALGTPFSWRSQPPSDVGAARFAFRVARPLPAGVTEGVAAPWFGQRGGGAMVVLDRPVRWYVDQGYLEPVGEPMEQARADALDRLDLLPSWQGVSYRGLPPGPLPPAGTLFRTTAVTVTSRSPRVATENFTVGALWAINGRSGRAVEQLSDDVEAREVLFRPGSFLRVVRLARVGDLPVVLLEDEAFWEGGPAPGEPSVDDFAAEVATRVLAAREWDDVVVRTPGRFAGPIR